MESNNIILLTFHKYLRRTFQFEGGVFTGDSALTTGIGNLQRKLANLMTKLNCTSHVRFFFFSRIKPCS